MRTEWFAFWEMGRLVFQPGKRKRYYQRILVTAGSQFLPDPLMRQLKRGGVMVIPLGGRDSQKMTMVIKGESGEVEILPFLECAFVPLTGTYGWDRQSE